MFTKKTNRYLSKAEKRKVIASWEKTCNQPYLDSVGSPDPDVFKLVDFLNGIDGVCALQSCSGHIRNGIIDNACLWIKLNRRMAHKFYSAAPKLAQHELIESVSFRFGTGEGEIIEIYFKGNASGLFSQSEVVIMEFFRGLY